MYIYIYICVYIYIYTHTYVCMCIYMYTCIHHHLNGYLVLQGNIHFRTDRPRQLLEPPAAQILGTPLG